MEFTKQFMEAFDLRKNVEGICNKVKAWFSRKLPKVSGVVSRLADLKHPTKKNAENAKKAKNANEKAEGTKTEVKKGSLRGRCADVPLEVGNYADVPLEECKAGADDRYVINYTEFGDPEGNQLCRY